MTICDFEQPECAECGATMMLEDGCEWDDDPKKNICHQCAMKRLEKAEAELAECREKRDHYKKALNEIAETDDWGAIAYILRKAMEDKR